MECGLETVGTKYLKNKVVSGQQLGIKTSSDKQISATSLMAHWRLQKDHILGRPLTAPRSSPRRVPETWRGYRKEADVFILRDSYKGDKVDGCNRK